MLEQLVLVRVNLHGEPGQWEYLLAQPRQIVIDVQDKTRKQLGQVMSATILDIVEA